MYTYILYYTIFFITYNVAVIMQGACTTAAAAVNARIDAAALKAAEHRLCSKTSSGAATTKAETVTMCRLLLRHLRAVKVCDRGQSLRCVMHQYI